MQKRPPEVTLTSQSLQKLLTQLGQSRYGVKYICQATILGLHYLPITHLENLGSFKRQILI